ncbi:hypothetical protein CgunFtcFv8_004447 [Champsocephalus gunnari]|uniref:Uncharacterized protein n=1 Tax=Champsocephalus gunnari TaxID=52237 RepID=A0AAN8I816_CHAGU|nr:hypothetical protein CgunFtcFv8_004447 [Champsocephalus gunnari]
MLASQCWHTEDHFRLVESHRVLPSLCPLPSAVNTGGEAILLPLEVRSRKKHLALVLVTAGLGLKNWFQSLQAGIWASQVHGIDTLCLRLPEHGGGGGGVSEYRVSAVPCCPTGNDTQPGLSQR